MAANNGADRARIIETIRKLAELANPEHGGFPQEIATASRKMEQLMQEYNVAWAEVLLTKTEQQRIKEFKERVSVTAFGMMKAWQWSLARAISRITTTKYFSMSFGSYRGAESYRSGKVLRKGVNMAFFGGEEQAQLACDLFDEWVVKIDLMARKATGEYCQDLTATYGIENPIKNFKKIVEASDYEMDENDHPTVWRNSWLQGVVSGMNEALYEEEKARKQAEEEERVKSFVRTPEQEAIFQEMIRKLVEAGILTMPEATVKAAKAVNVIRTPEQKEAFAQRVRGLMLSLHLEEEEAINKAANEVIKTGATPSSNTALMVVESTLELAYAEHSKHFRKANSSSSGRGNSDAYTQGREIGKSLRPGAKKLGGG